MLQIGGAFSEAVATAGASFVLVKIVNYSATHFTERTADEPDTGESQTLRPRGDEAAS